MPSYKFETFDVFTDRRFAGNQLAVLTDARGLSTEAMQTITREFNLAETTFVLPPDDPAHDARLRIFTIGYEMPFAGHPTVGTAIAIARARRFEGELKLELKAGLFRVQVSETDGLWRAQFANPNLPKETGGAPPPDALERALHLPAGAADRGAHKPRRVGAGVDYVFVRAPLDAVRKARLNPAAFDALGLDGVIGILLYADGGEAKDAAFHVRMFAPGAGVAEDPATGSAAAALPGQIALSERLADGAHRWIIEQGFEIGRPSRIEVDIECTHGAIRAVRVGGAAVPVSTGEIEI